MPQAAVNLKHLNESHDLSGAEALGPFQAEAHARKVPLNVQLQLTDRCNLACEFCYNSLTHKPRELSVEEIDAILDQLRVAGTLFITLTGGEPTLHPRFFDIARMVRDKGFALEVITNATLLTPRHFAFFKEVGVRYIAVSLHGLEAASHDRLTRSPDSFNKTLRSIEQMRELGIPVQLRIPVTRYNIHELDGLMHYAEMMGISHRLDCNITYREDGDQSSTAPRLDESGLSRYHQRVWSDWLAANPEVDVAGLTPHSGDGHHLCAAGHTYCYIDSVGTLHPCPSYQRPIGSLRDASFAELWFGSDFLRRLRAMTHDKLQGCGGCSDKPFCSFCPGDARLEGVDRQDGWGQYDRACDNAAINRQAFEAMQQRAAQPLSAS